ncbi:hypothetical protein D9758_003019 [Tetrapyrgos nigripes]|uniref:Uncharacterized protein n=1 Tax=Tetrapyrgos nigripes TaxID=182062 RepID=A0A8H5LTB8_9AGAR|nr:hypothetical protein D9758_003019 [Tetrapyrgos nigripes]
MAGALSSHIIESFYSRNNRSAGPFGMPFTNSFTNNSFGAGPSNIVTNGAMSFDTSMHGNSHPMALFTDDPSFLDLTRNSATQIAALQAKLNQQLGPEYISTRPGPGGGPKLVYAEGWKIINLANEVFGFNGWSSNLVNMTTDFCDFNEETRRYNVGVTAIVRVTLRDGVFHEDVGYGMLENSKSKGQALDKCKKEAVTDGLKRALRSFGNLLGNCLYDKSYTSEIIKVKVQQPKFDKSTLHRRPEFAEPKPEPGPSASTSTAASTSTSVSTTTSYPNQATSSTNRTNASSTTKPATNPQRSSHSARDELIKNILEVGSSGQAATTSTSTPNPRSKQEVISKPPVTGLNTPITTPAANPAPAQAARKVQFAASPLATKAPPPPPQQAQQSNHLLQQSYTVQKQVEDDNDSFYGLGSEDDAFLATVDLGEGDLGRPIDPEEGLGGVSVDQSTTTPFLDNSVGTSEPVKKQQYESVPEPRRAVAEPTPILQNSNTSRREFIFGGQASSSTSSSSRTHQQQTSHSYNRPNENQNPVSHSSDGRIFSTPSFKDFNGTSTPASASGGRRGGFSFPAEVKQQPQPQAQQQQQQGFSSVGMKRNHDAMRSSTPANPAQTSRRPAQGMGLMNAQGNAVRQPLGALDVSDSGDVKRMRR